MPEYESWVEYRPIPDFPDYLVGLDGSVWTCKRHGKKTAKNNWGRGEWRRLKSSINRDNKYHYVTLCRPKVYPRRIAIHTLVITLFVGSPPTTGLQVRHLDGDKSNNTPSNLAWGTPKENSEDRVRHGRQCCGSRNHRAKLTETDIPRIRQLLRESMIPYRIGKLFGVNESAIAAIAKGKTWKHVA